MKTCSVICDLDNGLVIDHVGPPVLAYDGVDHPPIYALYPGRNDDVPHASIAKWLRENKHLRAVKTGKVRIVDDSAPMKRLDVLLKALRDPRPVRGR